MRKLTAQLIILFFSVFILCAASPVNSQDFAKYCNDRYGFCIDYPGNLTMNPPPDNEDGRRFHDSNGFLLIVSGSNNILNNTLETEMKSGSGDIDKITYRAKRKNWFVLSGFKGSDIVYLKTYVGKGAINNLYIKYPARMKMKYNGTVMKISQSFKPGDLKEAH
jgi:hypothetical protein